MRPRTTKDLAKRIELEYYRRLHPWRRWRRIASAAAAGIAVIWVVSAFVRRDYQMFNSGPVSVAHAVFGARCTACHVSVGSQHFLLHTTDKACNVCHDGPTHHENQMFTPECVSCHVEHKGHIVLAALTDPHCTRCHAQLSVRRETRTFAARVTDFTRDHPEFAVLRIPQPDTAQVKLNHEVHLKPGLRGPHGSVQMICADCHRAGTSIAAWPYGQPATSTPSLLPYARGRYMNRIEYAQHCAGCHPLDFDARVPTAAPHTTPDTIRGFLRLTYIDYAAQHPDDVSGGGDEEAGGLRRHSDDTEQAGAVPEQWIRTQVAAAEELLYRTKNKGCLVCHALEAGDGLPRVVPSAIPQRWFAHAVFDHRSHRELRCIACHDKAPTSRETSDVLLPGIDACRKCHFASGGARAGCVECHLYHDKPRERDPNGPLLIRELEANH